MKKFTLFLAIMAVVLFANGQSAELLQKRMDVAKKKYAQPASANFQLLNHSKFQSAFILVSEKYLKSAAATMKLDSTVSQVWNDANQVLENETKEEFLYDSEMKNTMWLHSDWDNSSGTWDVWSKTEVDFNPDGTVSTMYIYESHEQGAEPSLINKLNAFYNDAGQLDSVQHWYALGPDTWVLEGRQHYLYDDSGRLTEMKVWSLEEDEGEEYMAAMRFVFTYTNSDRMETSSMFFLFEEEEILFFKTEYNYDGSGRLVFTEDLSLNLLFFELEKNARTDFEYNASGDVSTETYSLWDATSEEWIPDETDEYTYYDFNNSEVFLPSYLLFYGIVEEFQVPGKAVKEIETMEWNEGTSQLSAKTIFYYSAGTNTYADNLNKAGFSIYPNPASETVIFNWDSNQEKLNLEVFQIAGAKIFQRLINSGDPVSVSALENGIYLYKLQNGTETLHSGKLIKK
ncbi:T9SS type A sorting domain-containing protein [Mariniphaga sp.]|uniref:T9SS type A sorting domain-containing protein n=1 Tax=Mariniphaga sp. TaxID=1954475 RepID=UPI003563EF11